MLNGPKKGDVPPELIVVGEDKIMARLIIREQRTKLVHAEIITAIKHVKRRLET